MLQNFNSFKKYFKSKHVSTQDFVFSLHSKVTFALLIIASIALSLNQFFGKTIECKSSSDNLQAWAEQYCWTHGTYIFKYRYEEKNYRIHDHQVGYGIHPNHFVSNLRSKTDDFDENRVYLRYYQWVIPFLTIQAICFAIPGFIWTIWEKNRLQQLCELLDDVVFDMEAEKQQNRVKYLKKYFTSGVNDINLSYSIKYSFCEVLNFLVCIFNLIFLNIFFMDFWVSYASVVKLIPLYNWDEWNFYASKLFPKIVKCDVHLFGPSGDVEKRDILCLLPLNILNEKLFAFFYIWFLILTFLSGLNLLFRLSLLTSKSLRVLLLKAQARYLNTSEISKVLVNLNYGDWYLLYKICCNCNPLLFKELWYELQPYQKTLFEKAEMI